MGGGNQCIISDLYYNIQVPSALAFRVSEIIKYINICKYLSNEPNMSVNNIFVVVFYIDFFCFFVFINQLITWLWLCGSYSCLRAVASPGA